MVPPPPRRTFETSRRPRPNIRRPGRGARDTRRSCQSARRSDRNVRPSDRNARGLRQNAWRSPHGARRRVSPSGHGAPDNSGRTRQPIDAASDDRARKPRRRRPKPLEIMRPNTLRQRAGTLEGDAPARRAAAPRKTRRPRTGRCDERPPSPRATARQNARRGRTRISGDIQNRLAESDPKPHSDPRRVESPTLRKTPKNLYRSIL